MSRRRLWPASVVAGLLLVALSGCQMGEDDEMVQTPRATITRTTPARPAPAMPGSVPVGDTALVTSGPVWAQGSVVHVDGRSVDLSPRQVDAFVTTERGLYFMDRHRLWFTDLARVRDTGVPALRSLAATRTGDRIVVVPVGQVRGHSAHAYDTRTGRAVDASRVDAVTRRQRLGRPAEVAQRDGGVDLSPAAGGQRLEARLGPGGFGVVPGLHELVAFDAGTGDRVPLRGVSPVELDLVAWTGPASFYGLSHPSGSAAEVVSCDLEDRRCRSWGSAVGDGPVVFDTGH